MNVDLIVGEASAVAVVPINGDAVSGNLLDALYSGLGIPVPPAAQARPAEQLRLVGQLLRTSIEGTLKLMAARAIAKHEFGAVTTLVQARENNPLKFSAEVNEALTLLLGPPRRGFMPPLTGLNQAYMDLRAHELALLSGLRAALDSVLSSFDPSTLELGLPPAGLLKNLVSGSREAKLWALFCERHGEFIREIDADFDAVLGDAFRQAYERQLLELADAPAPPEAPKR